jgi:acyl-CoA reductase-like NAD-dependent aldehyde dehydrogenase
VPESGAIVSVKESHGLFSNGEFTPSADGHAFKTTSSASEEVLAEVLATSDVPGGVINVLTDRTAEVAPWLASHIDVNAIDLTGAPAVLSEELAVAAAENVKRVLRGVAKDGREED